MTNTLTPPNYLRQTAMFDPAKHPDSHVMMVGVGGIGSFTSLALAKLGIKHLTLVDPDMVEDHNLPNQMFPSSQVGEPKVQAAMRQAFVHNPECIIQCKAVMLEDQDFYGGIVVSGLDSMEARHNLWYDHIKNNPAVPRYIDARLDGERVVIYTVRPTVEADHEGYEATLYSDDEAEAGACTARNIIDVGFLVASQITRAVRRELNDDPLDAVTFINVENNTIMKQGGWSL
jgi:molybdopterin-synthase adenylyltransferase